MKVHDALIGAALIVFGAVVLWHVQGFPPIPGQKYGAALFPRLVAAGLVLCGVLLVARGMRAGGPWLALGGWTGHRRAVLAFLSVPAGLGLYLLLADPLGFHLTGTLLLLGWTLTFGARPAVAVSVAVLAPIVIHLAFYKLLRIPLPWGVLERVVF
ncbi:MAG TPA: tripartite tricarboxylate transporter TctB family protein [Burkholderiales bacterium]|nr:tripartite tricarboxylate transporter TctB family protein [Burkholderiales bacterium]